MPEDAKRTSANAWTQPLTLGALTAEFRPSLARYFARRVKDQSEIEDLVQEVFVRLVRRPDVAAMDGARGYVFETASSVLNDWLRRRRTHHAADHDPFDPDAHQSPDLAPDRVLISRERLARATAILLELPERTRTIFVLRRIEGLKHREIAKRLGLSVSAVEKAIRRATAHLVARLDDET